MTILGERTLFQLCQTRMLFDLSQWAAQEDEKQVRISMKKRHTFLIWSHSIIVEGTEELHAKIDELALRILELEEALGALQVSYSLLFGKTPEISIPL